LTLGPPSLAEGRQGKVDPGSMAGMMKGKAMFSHIMVGSNDIDRSKNF
jgi:hypothetical protein